MLFNKKFKKILSTNHKGIGLVETVLALGISVVIITSLVSLTVYTIRSSLQSKLMLQSTKKANEQLERLRAKRDSTPWSTPTTGFRALVTNCNPSSGAVCIINQDLSITGGLTPAVTTPVYFYATDVTGGYLDGTDTMIRFHVVVNWTVGNQNKSTYNYTDLTNWRGN